MDILTHLFDWLVSATVRASLVTLGVIIIRAILKHRVPPRWQYALWLPVLIVLLMPGFPESSLSVSSIFESTQAPKPMSPIIAPQLPLPAADLMAPSPEISQPINWKRVMIWVWLTGTAGVFLIGTLSLAWTLRQIKRTRLPLADIWFKELHLLTREIGLRRSPRVWMASAVRGPAVAGFLHPTLLLPANFDESLTPQEASLVLKHELTHIKRGDLPLNALLCLLLALHWFNPLLWLAFFKARLDREAACDAQVLASENQAQRVAYGHTLLKVESTFSHHGLSLGFVGIFQRGTALRSRIQSIASQPNNHPLMKTAISLSITLLTFFGITRAATTTEDAPKIFIQAKFIEFSEHPVRPLPAPLDATNNKPGLIGALTDPQLQVFMKDFSQRIGVDMMSAPTATTLSGQKVKIEVAREFEYADESGKQKAKKVGVTLPLLSTVKKEGQLHLEMSPEIVDFMGYKLEKSGHKQPMFSESAIQATGDLASGETLVVELPVRVDVIEVKDHKDGKIIRGEETLTKRTLLFVTASLVDPATGKPSTPKMVATTHPIQTKLETLILPRTQFSGASLEEAVEFLRAKSRELDTATMDPLKKGVNFIIKKPESPTTARITLDLKDMPLLEVLKYVTELANVRFTITNFTVEIGPHSEIDSESASRTNPSPNPASSNHTLTKEINLPKVIFHEATLAEAIQFIRVKSLELDPDKKGINIVVKPGGNPTVKITLSLKDVPVSEALRYCAELSEHKISVEKDVIGPNANQVSVKLYAHPKVIVISSPLAGP